MKNGWNDFVTYYLVTGSDDDADGGNKRPQKGCSGCFTVLIVIIAFAVILGIICDHCKGDGAWQIVTEVGTFEVQF